MGGEISGRTSEEAEGILSILRRLWLELQPAGPFWNRTRVFQASKDGRNKKKGKKRRYAIFFLARNCLFIKKIHRSTVLHRNEIEHNRGHEPRDARHLADRAWNREEFKHNQIRDTFQPSYSVHDNPRNRFHDWKYVPLSRGVLLASFGRVRTSNNLVIHRVFIVLWQNEKIYKKKKKYWVTGHTSISIRHWNSFSLHDRSKTRLPRLPAYRRFSNIEYHLYN